MACPPAARRRRRRKSAEASWTCSGTESAPRRVRSAENEGAPRLFGCVARPVREELPVALRVDPLRTVELVVEAAGPGGHPDFVQGLLQVHDDLAAVREGERDHPADPLVVDV